MRWFTVLFLFVSVATPAASERAIDKANEVLLQSLREVHALSPEQVDSLRAVFRRSGSIGKGNPTISDHPATEENCKLRMAELHAQYDNASFVDLCGGRYMAPLYDPATQTASQATVCIDQFEFPNIPCSYPVVWVRAVEAVKICEILGKRLCDAHEWEGACAGSLGEPRYRFDLASGQTPSMAIRLMREAHNRIYSPTKTWSYGREYRTGICATSGKKSPGCDGGSWSLCGSNTFPTGYYPECHSPLLVYDLNGNAAEHMNLPLEPGQMASRGSRVYGYTEMKGSWFIFDSYRAHDDWCRWRAPFWHGSRVLDPKSHRNYHLGFRCCKTIAAAEKPKP